MGKILNILTSDPPPVLLGQFSHWALLKKNQPGTAQSVRSAVLLLGGSGRRSDNAWSPGQHGTSIDEVRVLTGQLLESTDSLGGVVVATAVTTQQPQERALELTVEHCVDDWVEGTRRVAEPQEHLAAYTPLTDQLSH